MSGGIAGGRSASHVQRRPAPPALTRQTASLGCAPCFQLGILLNFSSAPHGVANPAPCGLCRLIKQIEQMTQLAPRFPSFDTAGKEMAIEQFSNIIDRLEIWMKRLELSDDTLAKKLLSKLSAYQLEVCMVAGMFGMKKTLQSMLSTMRRHVELESRIQDVQHLRWFQQVPALMCS